MYTLRQKVIWFAISSRILILLLQCISNAIIPDHNADDVFRRPMPPNTERSVIDSAVDVLFGGLERWDAQYFLHIAENGYVYENTLAFFPLFPIAVRSLCGCFKFISFGLLGHRSLLLLATISLNTVCFVKAADALFCLSVKVLENEILAYKAALLFCINPASIFFSAPYSEALFVLLSFQGMSHSLDSQYSELCAIPFGLAAAARSNGILNIGFIVHGSVKQFVTDKWPILSKKRAFKRKLMLIFKALPSFCRMIESSTIALAPFIAYQVYCYVLFCTPQKLNIQEHVLKFGQDNGLLMPEFNDTFSRNSDHWCHFKLPLAYSYVQEHYWNVGFFRYYEWKQLPNFILACPILFLVLSQSKKYFLQHESLFLYLGLKPTAKLRDEQSNSSMSPNMLVFVVHAVFLTLFCITFVHIQVSTRMICSASPVPYWYAAYMLNYKEKKERGKSRDGRMLIASQLKKLNFKKSDQEGCTKEWSTETIDNMNSKWRVKLISELPDTQGRVILTYFLLYAFSGTILFSNFLPWT